MIHYTETQRFTQPWLWALILGVTGIFWYIGMRQLAPGRTWGADPVDDGVLVIAWLLLGVGLPALFLFGRLRTEVRDDGISVQFRPFHRRPRVWSYDRIARIAPREYSPLREFGGWGIRIGPSGWAYNVKGNQGMELTFKLGHRILIGTQDREAFMAALSHVHPEPTPSRGAGDGARRRDSA